LDLLKSLCCSPKNELPRTSASRCRFYAVVEAKGKRAAERKYRHLSTAAEEFIIAVLTSKLGFPG
jgi:hypothetical protein